jgi:hypothetical protein
MLLLGCIPFGFVEDASFGEAASGFITPIAHQQYSPTHTSYLTPAVQTSDPYDLKASDPYDYAIGERGKRVGGFELIRRYHPAKAAGVNRLPLALIQKVRPCACQGRRGWGGGGNVGRPS